MEKPRVFPSGSVSAGSSNVRSMNCPALNVIETGLGNLNSSVRWATSLRALRDKMRTCDSAAVTIASTGCQQHCQHAEEKSCTERDHPQRIDRKSMRDGCCIAARCGRVRVLAGNSVPAHDASESFNASVEREKTVEDIAAPDKRLIFAVRIGFADTRMLRAVRLRSIDNADQQLHFLSLVRHVIGH